MTTHRAHAYFSTACHHRRHSDCRKTCKYCGTECFCICHSTVVANGEMFLDEEPVTEPERKKP